MFGALGAMGGRGMPGMPGFQVPGAGYLRPWWGPPAERLRPRARFRTARRILRTGRPVVPPPAIRFGLIGARRKDHRPIILSASALALAGCNSHNASTAAGPDAEVEGFFQAAEAPSSPEARIGAGDAGVCVGLVIVAETSPRASSGRPQGLDLSDD